MHSSICRIILDGLALSGHRGRSLWNDSVAISFRLRRAAFDLMSTSITTSSVVLRCKLCHACTICLLLPDRRSISRTRPARSCRRARRCTMPVSYILFYLSIHLLTKCIPVPNIIVGTPIKRNFQVTPSITNQLTRYFGVAYEGLRARELRDRLDMTTLVRYGRFRLVSDGDRIRVADTIARDPGARDNSFIRVCPSSMYLSICFALLTSQYY